LRTNLYQGCDERRGRSVTPKTVADKLLIKPGATVRVLGKTPNSAALLGPMPSGAGIIGAAADVVVLFVQDQAEVESTLTRAAVSVKPGGVLWVAWPKQTSKLKSDVTRDTIYAYGLQVGLEGVANVSIDSDWSALRLKQV
jgi:hypothetical protein